MEGMDDIIKEFVMESMEGLDKVDQERVALEADPARLDILKSIFRTVHTIKGSCGFLELKKLEKVAHIGENLLARLRDAELSMNGQIANALLAMVDALRSMMNSLNAGQGEGDTDYSSLINVLTALHLGQNPGEVTSLLGASQGGPEEEDLDSLVDALAAPFTVETLPVQGDKPGGFKVELAAVKEPVPAPRPAPAAATSLGAGLFPAGLARPSNPATPAPPKAVAQATPVAGPPPPRAHPRPKMSASPMACRS